MNKIQPFRILVINIQLYKIRNLSYIISQSYTNEEIRSTRA